MPIFGLNEEIELNLEEKQDQSIVPMFDSERTNEELRSYIAGYKWEVTYFHRNITEDEFVSEYDANLDPALQEYTRIDNFIINVETPLDSTIAEGSGIIDLGTVPNPNDLFIAKMMDGKPIMFAIRNITKPDYNNEKVFKVEYINMGEITGNDDPYLVTLLKSTVNDYTYNKAYRVTKTQPLLTKKEVSDKKTFFRVIDDLVTFWSNKFITQDTNFYMAFKDGNSTIYDPQMETFIRYTIGINNISDRVETVEVQDRKISILDIFVNDEIGRGRVNRYTNYLDTSDLSKSPYLFSLEYIQVDDIIDVTKYPQFEEINDVINTVFPKVEAESYIFRKDVYNAILNPDMMLNTVTFTKFEQLVIATMNGDTIKKETLLEIYDNIFDIPDEEQFYFIPILIYIIRYYLNTFTVKFI